MPVTKDQAHMAAALGVWIRRETQGAGDWDAPGIVAAIAPHAAMTLAEVVRAVTRAAEDVTAKTPGVLRDTRNPCWRERSEQRPTPRQGPIPAEERCTVCRLREPQCAARQQAEPRDARHDFEPDFRNPADPTAEVAHLRTLIRATEGATEPIEGA